MSLHGIYLKEFGQSAAICTGQETLGTILSLLHQANRDRLVVVNDQHHPIGIIRCNILLPLLLRLERENNSPAPLSPVWEQPFQALVPDAVTQLIVVPDAWTVAQILPALHNTAEHDYALVNAAAEFQGLLDCDRLLRHVIQSTAQPIATAELKLPQPTQQQQIVTLTQQLLAQRAELEQRIKTQQQEITRLNRSRSPNPFADPDSIPSFEALAAPPPSTRGTQPPSLLTLLLQVLDRLPLPIMLQTGEGVILAQNSVWCQQMSELTDPMKIWREAAVWLGTEGEENQPSTQFPLFQTTSSLVDDRQPSAIAPLPLTPDSPPPEPSLCQLGSHPNHCVCACPLKNGHERIVQFVKISLKTLLPDLTLNWLTAPIAHSEIPAPPAQDAASPLRHFFQLAALAPAPPTAAIANPPPTTQTTVNPATAPAPQTPSLWLVLAHDVTHQQHLARELTAKNADLVQLNRLKDEFLACISHELKTPLTAVLGLSSLLKDQTLGELNQRQVHYAQLIYQSSRHLMGVVNDILDLTRIETGQMELMYGAVDIAVVCSRAFEQAKQLRLADSKNPDAEEERLTNPQIHLHIEPHLKTIVADEIRLRQMLAHLLSNAVKFTPATNPLGLRVSRWGGWIAFTVWDTGIGISADKQHLIFQKFQQLENPLTRQFEGAGLGLVLTRRLARMHGGDVTFISKEGTGSQFTILLPPSPPDKTQLTRNSSLQEEELPEPELSYPSGRVPIYFSKAAQKVDRSGGGATSLPDRLVLIVDAVAQYVEALTDQLTGLGYRVVIARSGTEALEKARRLQPCVIFLNPLLPLLSGWDVLTLLKSGAETQHLPVVVTATVIDEERAHQHQADGFLQLPVKAPQLQALLQQFRLATKKAGERSPAQPLTLLRLSGQPPTAHPPLVVALDELLQSQRYRILEADDLEQAALLSSVWQPHVMLLEGAIADPVQYLHHLTRYPLLATLPIVTLDPQIAQTANQIAGLQIFPCLLQTERATNEAPPDWSTLLEVIQLAAGCVWQPSILVLDVAMLTETAAQPTTPTGAANREISRFPREAGWLQALIQYLQTAGLVGAIGHSWQAVMQQLRSQSVDLVLLCWTHGEPTPAVMEWLTQLQDLRPKPPILVLDHRDPELGETTLIPLPRQVRDLATGVLSPPISMSELLEQIQRTLQG